jgi:hypothetical protein
MLGMAHIRALEVATFYFMFQLQPVGSVAHIQVCGTTSCMICGAEDLIAVCRDKIAKPKPHELSADGKFSWEEVECLGRLRQRADGPDRQGLLRGPDGRELGEILDEMAAGGVPTPGPQNGRYAGPRCRCSRRQLGASSRAAMLRWRSVRRLPPSPNPPPKQKPRLPLNQPRPHRWPRRWRKPRPSN